MMSGKREVWSLGALLAAALVSALVVLVAAGAPVQAATDRLPDLGMARLLNLQIVNEDGERHLRFGATIANVGAGPLEARGSRSSTSTPTMNVRQRIYNDAGGFRDRSTTATMYFSGDGHNHWHLKNLERYELIRLDSGSQYRTGAKQGFCFMDNTNFGSSQPARYQGCGNGQPGLLAVTMGISRGWGDNYSVRTVGQYVDITGLPDGNYRLRATADPGGWFSESNETNNVTWTDVRITGNTLTVLAYGPRVRPI
jgi:hypothetical protein